MKKTRLILFIASVLLFPGCDTLKTVGSTLGLSQTEIAAGLKEALTQGLFSGFEAFANPKQGNALVRFAFPGDAAKIEKNLKDLGLTSVVNQMTNKFTTAMSQAVVQAKPIFINSVKNMSIQDATSLLLTQNTHAATEYFKSKMTPELMAAFTPIVDQNIKTTGADKQYETIVKAYNAIPFTNQKLEPNLNHFIAGRAIDAMFLSVASEEEKIRSNISFRKTDLMKKVFGYADQQLRLKKTIM